MLDRDFHDVSSHSGEPYKTFNWAINDGSGSVGWKTTEFATDPNANAIRWGTMYNFTIVADTPPADGAAELEIFKNNDVVSVDVKGLSGSGNPYDLNGDGVVDGHGRGHLRPGNQRTRRRLQRRRHRRRGGRRPPRSQPGTDRPARATLESTPATAWSRGVFVQASGSESNR